MSVIMGVIMGALLVAVPAFAQEGPGKPFPETPLEALRVHEFDIDKWDDGPSEYLMLEEERKIWKELETTEERRRFVDWFWARRDDDRRDEVNPFKAGFYRRVAEANDRFGGLPRGWKSDRGRVWLVLGKPNNLRRDRNDLTIWTYYARGILEFATDLNEMQVFFRQMSPSRYEIYGGLGSGIWPGYVLQVMDFINRAVIVEPDLEFDPGG